MNTPPNEEQPTEATAARPLRLITLEIDEELYNILPDLLGCIPGDYTSSFFNSQMRFIIFAGTCESINKGMQLNTVSVFSALKGLDILSKITQYEQTIGPAIEKEYNEQRTS